MPSNRNDPDPLEARRRQLAEQERLLSEQRRRLTEQLHPTGESTTSVKPAEPPVWRLEDDGPPQRIIEPTTQRKRNLARQTQRDMIVVLFLIVLFLIIVGVALWIIHDHDALPATVSASG